MIIKYLKSKNGVAIVAVMIFTVILLIFGATFLRLATTERIAADRNFYLNQSFYLAEAGAERTVAYLESLPAPPTGTLSFDPFGGWQSLDDAGFWRAVVDPNDNNPGSFLKRYTITAEGQAVTPAFTVTKIVEVELSRENFAQFIYFTNYEESASGQEIWFFNGDIIEGPVHSNDQINIYGSPTFMSLVTSTADSFNYYHGGPPQDNPDFQQGYQLGVTPIDMEKHKNLSTLEALSVSGGLKLTSDSKIQLNSSGTITYWLRTGGTWSNPTWGAPTTINIPSNGVVYVEGRVRVSGTLDGRLSIASESDIYISEDIVYSLPPTDPNCTDALGLIAANNIIVDKSSPAGGSLTIHATMMDFDGSFYVRNYDSIPVMGNLTVYGGIIQNRRGAVGTFYSYTGQRLSGYLKDYHYDTRVTDEPPPYFPTTGKYDRDSWEEQPAVWN
ncbi:MAG: DUF4900 domain-containing protein [Candidatus Ratteibacteria bacterium]|nr:DUF4900 domain-containing protein [Candidatus Ratteibacteria bacterium]